MQVYDPDTGRMVRVAYTSELAADLARLKKHRCQHPSQQTCAVPIGDGSRTQWRRQCLKCHALIGTALKPPAPGEPIGEYVPHSRDALWAAEQAMRDAVILEHHRRQRADYQGYRLAGMARAPRQGLAPRSDLPGVWRAAVVAGASPDLRADLLRAVVRSGRRLRRLPRRIAP